MTADPALPSAFGCTSCGEAILAQRRAEAMTGRLLSLLALSEAREARQRYEIGDLEQRLTRHAPKWEPDPQTPEPTGPVGSSNAATHSGDSR